jgi:hypothetical protein
MSFILKGTAFGRHCFRSRQAWELQRQGCLYLTSRLPRKADRSCGFEGSKVEAAQDVGSASCNEVGN